MHVLAILAVTAIAGFPPFILVAALWGYGSSWLNEVIKQDTWPKFVNTIIADIVLIISAALATVTDASKFTWHTFASAVLAAGAAALINHQFFLQPTGIGPKLQSATTVAPPRRAVQPAPVQQ